MTTNSPEIKIYESSEKGVTAMREASFRNTGPERYVRLSDYEALQAELARELQRRFDGNEQSSREHREEIGVLMEALEGVMYCNEVKFLPEGVQQAVSDALAICCKGVVE